MALETKFQKCRTADCVASNEDAAILKTVPAIFTSAISVLRTSSPHEVDSEWCTSSAPSSSRSTLMSQDAVILGEAQLARDVERYLGRAQAMQGKALILAQSGDRARASAAKIDAIAANERKIAEMQAKIAEKLNVLETERRMGAQLARLEARTVELARGAQTQKRKNQELERKIAETEAATAAAERECAQAKEETRAALAEAKEFQAE